ncbi:MAG: LpxD N-terminal domain-containing protein [Vicinamibacterales bacterium]|nr:LpxD N-terminal domain-containing protein [Vicinamibacterales bacterium]
MKLREAAARLECRLEGDGGVEIHRVAGVDTAQAGDPTFFANPRFATALRSTLASAVILAHDAEPAGLFVSGLPAIDKLAWRRASASFKLLPALRKRVADVERRLAEFEGATDERAEETGDRSQEPGET